MVKRCNSIKTQLSLANDWSTYVLLRCEVLCKNLFAFFEKHEQLDIRYNEKFRNLTCQALAFVITANAASNAASNSFPHQHYLIVLMGTRIGRIGSSNP